MKTDYSHVSLLDIVFENRNKAYGAYQLRSTYHHTMQRAMAITFGSVLALLLFKLLHDKLHRPTVAKPTEIISQLIAPVLLQQQEVVIKEPEKAPAARPKQTIKNPEMKVVNEQQATADTIADKNMLKQYDPGLTTNTSPTVSNTLGTDGGTGTATDLDALPKPAPPAPAIASTAEVMPSYPGGEEALFTFLRKHTQYPDIEHSMEIEGKAIVRFVVNEDGTVSQATVLRTDSKGFGTEAVRVVGKLGRFNPGRQGGKPVKVYFVLPFQFKLPRQ